ncbi:MAG: hypothetical protein ACTSVY_15265 [Candidatus Helarchaeota archaeon]
MIEKKASKKSTIHTTISSKAVDIFKKYLSKKKGNNENLYSSRAEIIEHALELLDKYHNPENQDKINLWKLFREDLDMVAVGKTTFLAYISKDNKKVFRENIAIEILEWYKKKNLFEMSLEEILNALKDIWIAANYFNKIEIEKGDKGSYQMYFYHNLRSKKYGKFWGEYFTEFLRTHKKCTTEKFIRNESFILNIKIRNDKIVKNH